MLKRRGTAMGAVWMIAIAGCGGGSGAGEDVPPESVQEAGALPPDVIAQLMDQYPTLRAEPAPEPEPSGDGDSAAPEEVLEQLTGDATFYADRFEGRRTASGIPFRQNQMVAAHRSFPFGTLLRVTNLRNDRSVNVRVVDRGPFGSSAKQRATVLDLSRRAAERLGYVGAGRTQVKVEVLEWGRGVVAATAT